MSVVKSMHTLGLMGLGRDRFGLILLPATIEFSLFKWHKDWKFTLIFAFGNYESRSWVEDEARKSQARAKVLEEVERRWKWYNQS